MENKLRLCSKWQPTSHSSSSNPKNYTTNPNNRKIPEIGKIPNKNLNFPWKFLKIPFPHFSIDEA
jgi:hypothetical protein